MPADALPFIAAIIAAFGVFTVGGAWIWTNMPDRHG